MHDEPYRTLPLHDRQGMLIAVALISPEDYAWAAAFRWYRSSEGYARRSLNSRKIYLHRELLGLMPGDRRLGDHINRNRLDNRRENLRIVTKAQQQQNLGAYQHGASRYRGVYRRAQSGRWVAQARRNGRMVSVGTFDSELEAARAAADFRRAHMPYSTETLEPTTARDPMLSVRGGTSRYVGVNWARNAKKWAASARVDGRQKHLGYFDDEYEAAKVAARARGIEVS